MRLPHLARSLATATAVLQTGPALAQQPSPIPEPPIRSFIRLESPLREVPAQELGAPGAVPGHLQGIVALLEVDEKSWQTLAAVEDALLAGLPIAPGQTVDALLHRRTPLEGTQVVSASLDANGQIVDVPLALPALTCFGGSLVGDPSSRVMIARHESFLIGFVITAEGRWIISSGAADQNGPLVAFRHSALPPRTLRSRDWACETLLPPDDRGDAGGGGRGDGGGDEGGIAGSGTCRQSRIAVETDHEFLLLFGGNQGAAAAYVATLFSALTDIYSRDVGLRPSPCLIRLWPTANDPWDGASTNAQLSQFRSVWEATPPAVQRNSAPGVIVSYYQLAAPQVLPNFTTLTQYAGGILNDINFASTGGNFATSGRAEEVGAVFRGWINIPTSGFWTLFTNSDDGSRLLIGETVVVTNDGLHAMLERSGTIALAAGKHAIRVEFFENGGGAGLIASWQGPSVAKAVVPASAWSRGGTYNWADIDRNGTVNGTDLSLLLAAWGTFNIPADINQDGIVSGADLSALLAA